MHYPQQIEEKYERVTRKKKEKEMYTAESARNGNKSNCYKARQMRSTRLYYCTTQPPLSDLESCFLSRLVLRGESPEIMEDLASSALTKETPE